MPPSRKVYNELGTSKNTGILRLQIASRRPDISSRWLAICSSACLLQTRSAPTSAFGLSGNVSRRIDSGEPGVSVGNSPDNSDRIRQRVQHPAYTASSENHLVRTRFRSEERRVG